MQQNNTETKLSFVQIYNQSPTIKSKQTSVAFRTFYLDRIVVLMQEGNSSTCECESETAPICMTDPRSGCGGRSCKDDAIKVQAARHALLFSTAYGDISVV